jgi:hypothetical protein
MSRRALVTCCSLLATVSLDAHALPPMRVDVGVGAAAAWANDERPWLGRSPAVVLRVRSDFSRHLGCEYSHTSNLRDGPPFNDRAESSLDFIGCTIYWENRQ